MTQEQEKLQADLLAQYGEVIFKQASEFSGLSLCLVALAADELAPAQREHLYRQASLHLAQLLETLMPAAHSANVTECAKRMDAALDTWMADDIERREGLPPLTEIRFDSDTIINGVLVKAGTVWKPT